MMARSFARTTASIKQSLVSLVVGLGFCLLSVGAASDLLGQSPSTPNSPLELRPFDIAPATALSDADVAITRDEFDAVLRRLAAAEAELRATREVLEANPTIPPGVDVQRETDDPAFASVLDNRSAAPPSGHPAVKLPTVQVNGVFQADAGFFHQSPNNVNAYGHIQDGADFRRARLSAKGSVTETVNYFFQMDFAFFGRPTFADVWFESTGHPVLGNIRIGQWKQPFSLEVVSSFRYTTFMERSVLFQSFTPFRHLGAGFYDHADNLSSTWAASFFRTGQDQFGDSISTDGGWGTAERVTWLPYWDDSTAGSRYLHLGAGHFFNSPPRDLVNFRTIPEIYIGENAPGVVGTSGQPSPGVFDGTPFFVKTGVLEVSQYNVFGGELLWVSGPFSLQSEAMLTHVQRANGVEADLGGAYAQVGYFLTGEHRPYDRKAGAIDRVIPFQNFYRTCTYDGLATGPGAWEIAARWSYIDLEDEDIHGGTMTDWTMGVNWYWNPYTKLAFNYVYSSPDLAPHGASHMNAFAMRGQIDF